MSQGFIAYNTSNQILISSDTRNLHFVQKLSTYAEMLYTNDNYGGIRRARYRATCSVTPLPFITMPSTEFYAISRITNAGGNQWDIEVLRTGNSGNVPEMYIFADPRASTATDSHGMLVYRDDGTPSFDSRLRPLAITGGLSVTHPSNPRPSFPYGLDAKYCGSSESTSGGFFAPTEYNTYSLTGQPAKPMFSFMSLAQAERQASYSASEEECDGATVKGNCVGAQRNYSWTSTYWCFYRGGIRYDGSSIRAGWIPVSFGCNWTYSRDGAFLGIGTGGASGEGGSWPYSNETINLTSNSVIVGDASRYD